VLSSAQLGIAELSSLGKLIVELATPSNRTEPQIGQFPCCGETLDRVRHVLARERHLGLHNLGVGALLRRAPGRSAPQRARRLRQVSLVEVLVQLDDAGGGVGGGLEIGRVEREQRDVAVVTLRG
jgi:hypothetical protein